MLFQNSIGLLVTLGSTLATAAPQDLPKPTGTIAKRDEKSYITDACTGMPDKDGYNYRMGLMWMQNGNIGGDGNPTIEDSGGVLTFDSDCNLQDEAGWNGGSGYLNEWMKFNPDDEDVGVKFKLENAALAAGWTRIQPPKDLKFENNGETVNWGHKVDCQKEWHTDGELGAVRYYRMCHFYAGRGWFEDQ